MRHCSLHPALTTCRAPLPPGKKYVAVRYLTKELIFFVLDAKGKGQEVLEDSCKYLGLQDADLFGLAMFQDGEYIFIDPNLKISKYAVRSWKTNENGIDGEGQPLLILYMKVKYYVDCHLLISEKVVRHHYYLQLRENVKNYSQALSEEKSFLLAALALQADLGNYCVEKHKGRYFEIQNYFPPWIVRKIGEDYIIRNIPALHKDNVGLSRGEAQVGYIKEASDDTAPHNLHFYKMRRKKGKIWSMVWLGIKDSGINIYEQLDSEHNTKNLLSTFLWCDIAKLHFEKKKFEIQSEGSPESRRFTYYVHNEDLAKNLLWLCQTTHHFHMSNQIRVQDLKKLELEGGKPYREAYIYTDKVDQAWERKHNTLSKNFVQEIGNEYTVNGNRENCGDKNLKSSSGKKSNQRPNMRRIKGDGMDISMSMLQHRSMESLPLTNGCLFPTDIKFKSQSISCFTDRALTPCPIFMHDNIPSHLWSPASNSSLSTTPTSTLLSRSSYTSCTDSACSSLSLTSGSTVKANTLNINPAVAPKFQLDDSSQWIKCDSFEELNVGDIALENKNMRHKVCISTFVDNHVRTASLYDAATIHISSTPKPQVSRPTSFKSVAYVSLIPSPVTPLKSTYALPGQDQHDRQILHSAAVRSELKQNDPQSKLLVNSSSVNHQAISGQNIHNSIQYFTPQNPNRHYQSNAPMYSRTATRIGVSSLSRDQRLPLTLFNESRKIVAAGSEPNLYNSMPDCDPSKIEEFLAAEDSTQCRLFNMGRPNSRSEMCLNALGNNSTKTSKINLIQSVCTKRNSDYISKDQIQFPDGSSELEGVGSDFPCIPPPPAYRNILDDNTECDVGQMSLPSLSLPSSSEQAIPGYNLRAATDAHRELCSSLSSPPNVLDLQQLREKSRDLDLPLISALCNDRSLLMLPKTVPTCSRQRHLGNKDPLKYRGYGTTIPNGMMTDLSSGAFPNDGRPVSWHVDSSRVPCWSDNPKPCSSLDVKDNSGMTCNGYVVTGGTKQNLPPTILTSFGKQSPHSRDNSNGSGNYRFNTSQMIPTKLLSGQFSNGRLHQKGSSS